MKHDPKKIKLPRDRERIILKLERSVKKIEDKLNKMGIKQTHRGPRISDPAHANKTSYLY